MFNFFWCPDYIKPVSRHPDSEITLAADLRPEPSDSQYCMALKREHPSEDASLPIVLPDLPQLSADTLLRVFSHKSLGRADQDNERLAVVSH